MPAQKRPEVATPMTLCTRTLTGPQTAATLVARNEPFTLTHPPTKENITIWAGELELDILIAFNIDPKRYKIRFHAPTPANQPCPELQELRSLNYLDLSDEKPAVTLPYEVHFVLRDDVPEPSVDDLRGWQQRWAVLSAEHPVPRPLVTAVTFCRMNKMPMRVDIAGLSRPLPGDVETTLREGLGLLTGEALFQANVNKVFGVDLDKDEVWFHLNSEGCESPAHDIDQLRTVPVNVTQAVRMHIRRGRRAAKGRMAN